MSIGVGAWNTGRSICSTKEAAVPIRSSLGYTKSGERSVMWRLQHHCPSCLDRPFWHPNGGTPYTSYPFPIAIRCLAAWTFCTDSPQTASSQSSRAHAVACLSPGTAAPRHQRVARAGCTRVPRGDPTGSPRAGRKPEPAPPSGQGAGPLVNMRPHIYGINPYRLTEEARVTMDPPCNSASLQIRHTILKCFSMTSIH